MNEEAHLFHARTISIIKQAVFNQQVLEQVALIDQRIESNNSSNLICITRKARASTWCVLGSEPCMRLDNDAYSKRDYTCPLYTELGNNERERERKKQATIKFRIAPSFTAANGARRPLVRATPLKSARDHKTNGDIDRCRPSVNERRDARNAHISFPVYPR